MSVPREISTARNADEGESRAMLDTAPAGNLATQPAEESQNGDGHGDREADGDGDTVSYYDESDPEDVDNTYGDGYDSDCVFNLDLENDGEAPTGRTSIPTEAQRSTDSSPSGANYSPTTQELANDLRAFQQEHLKLDIPDRPLTQSQNMAFLEAPSQDRPQPPPSDGFLAQPTGNGSGFGQGHFANGGAVFVLSGRQGRVAAGPPETTVSSSAYTFAQDGKVLEMLGYQQPNGSGPATPSDDAGPFTFDADEDASRGVDFSLVSGGERGESSRAPRYHSEQKVFNSKTNKFELMVFNFETYKFEAKVSNGKKDNTLPAYSGRTFYPFMDLPKELRNRIYAHALRSEGAIAPHLCDTTRPCQAPAQTADFVVDPKAIKFHDDNQVEHDAIYEMLAITCVSRQVRMESLPIFYGVNTFAAVADTPTYFTRLEHLGRFHMIRHVDFVVSFWKANFVPEKMLRMLLQNIVEQDEFESNEIRNNANAVQPSTDVKGKGKAPAEVPDDQGPAASAWPQLERYKPDPSKFYTNDYTVLKSHPQHLIGGLAPSFLVLRKLSSTFTDTGPYRHKLVIHVPIADLFEQHASLAHFPSVCDGLGISLHLVPGRAVDINSAGFTLSWHQKFQKKDFDVSTTTLDAGEHAKLDERVKELYPRIDFVPRPDRTSYYRMRCKGQGIEWFTVPSKDGAMG